MSEDYMLGEEKILQKALAKIARPYPARTPINTVSDDEQVRALSLLLAALQTIARTALNKQQTVESATAGQVDSLRLYERLNHVLIRVHDAIQNPSLVLRPELTLAEVAKLRNFAYRDYISVQSALPEMNSLAEYAKLVGAITAELRFEQVAGAEKVLQRIKEHVARFDAEREKNRDA